MDAEGDSGQVKGNHEEVDLFLDRIASNVFRVELGIPVQARSPDKVVHGVAAGEKVDLSDWRCPESLTSSI